MKYLSVADISKKWGLSERTIRNYCATGKIPNAFLKGKTWCIPETAQKPISQKSGKKRTLLDVLKMEKSKGIKGGIYHKIQLELTYNSNHMEGSKLTHDQTRYIYETNTIFAENGAVNVDDVVETANHFKCIDKIIDCANQLPSEALIKQLHATLKNGTSHSRKDWFVVGGYKKLPNEVGGHCTTQPEMVAKEMKQLLANYNGQKSKTLEQIIEFHVNFESIHPFSDGNGRIGRLLLFKECLRNNIVPFIIDDDLKMFYYRGLGKWKAERGYLMDTCLMAQDKFKKYLEYFKIQYQE